MSKIDFDIEFHKYADDNQIYITFNPNALGESESAKKLMEACITEIRSFMTSNYLKLNDDKTEFMLIGSNINLKKVSQTTVKIGDEIIHPTDQARNIGVTFDCNLSLTKHIQKTTKAAWFHLWNISKIRKFLDVEATKGLCHALITSKLDFCNSLLHGIPDEHLKPLTKIQKSTVRLIYRLKKDRVTHITPFMIELR